MATGGRVEIEFPLVALTKTQIVVAGNALVVPWDLTYSCYAGEAEPCGTCQACWVRQGAFAQAELGRERPARRERALLQVETAGGG